MIVLFRQPRSALVPDPHLSPGCFGLLCGMCCLVSQRTSLRISACFTALHGLPELPAKGSYVLTLCFWQRLQHVASWLQKGARVAASFTRKCL